MLLNHTLEELEEVLVEDEVDETDSGSVSHLIVYNDDHNTFDWVIECFMDVLGHTTIQSEQLALIIHLKGKAVVKSGSKKSLMPQKDALIERGLSAIIEEEDK